MRIGELARHAGLNPRTIRYYEAIGLLPAPQRTAAGYRRYDHTAVSRLGFIQRAKQLGLSLDEIHAILTLHERGEPPCDRVLTFIDAELARIADRIASLARLHADLTTLRAQQAAEASTRVDAGCVCPIIDAQTEASGQIASPHPLDLPAGWKV